MVSRRRRTSSFRCGSRIRHSEARRSPRTVSTHSCCPRTTSLLPPKSGNLMHIPILSVVRTNVSTATPNVVTISGRAVDCCSNHLRHDDYDLCTLIPLLACHATYTVYSCLMTVTTCNPHLLLMRPLPRFPSSHNHSLLTTVAVVKEPCIYTSQCTWLQSQSHS